MSIGSRDARERTLNICNCVGSLRLHEKLSTTTKSKSLDIGRNVCPFYILRLLPTRLTHKIPILDILKNISHLALLNFPLRRNRIQGSHNMQRIPTHSSNTLSRFLKLPN